MGGYKPRRYRARALASISALLQLFIAVVAATTTAVVSSREAFNGPRIFRARGAAELRSLIARKRRELCAHSNCAFAQVPGV